VAVTFGIQVVAIATLSRLQGNQGMTNSVTQPMSFASLISPRVTLNQMTAAMITLISTIMTEDT